VSELIKTKQTIVLVWEDVLHVQTSAVCVTMYLRCGVIKLPAVRRFLTHCGDLHTPCSCSDYTHQCLIAPYQKTTKVEFIILHLPNPLLPDQYQQENHHIEA